MNSHSTFNKKIEAMISGFRTKQNGILIRTVPFEGGMVHICYISQLVDRKLLSEFVIKPIAAYGTGEKRTISASYAFTNLIYADECSLSDDFDQAEQHILSGKAVLLFTTDSRYITVNCQKTAQRAVSPPEIEYSYRAPRDAFVETLDENLSLIRYRLKDANLRIEMKQLGARTKTMAAVLYIDDIVNPHVLNEVNKRIDGIQTDAVYESGELQSLLLNKRTNLFPQIGVVERSDHAVDALTEGRVIILVNGSNLALQIPKTFPEFFYACDDRYENKYFGLFMRIIRYIGVFVSLTATSYYLAVAEFAPDVLPASYIVTFAQMRSRAPFPAAIAVLSIEFIVELMRESLIRVPTKIGSAIGIVGAIIIGQAASASGVYSSLLLILVSMGFLASFVLPDFTLSSSMRIIKFFVILCTACFGFYGFSLALLFILALIVSDNSFGIPYFTPWAPFNRYDFKRSLIFDKADSPSRPRYLQNKDATRAPGGDKK